MSLYNPWLWLYAVTLAFWVLMETLATTVGLHRLLTHQAFETKPKVVRWFMWWIRSGGVRYREWVILHLWHHANTDTVHDSYSPRTANTDTGRPPLPLWKPWRFWDNAVTYHASWKWHVAHSEAIKELAARDPNVQRAMNYLEDLNSLEAKYSNVMRGLWINLTVFSLAALPLSVSLVGWFWAWLVAFALGWVAMGIKYYCYLSGGQIINTWGHNYETWPYQSNIPWWIMLPTLGVMGEGWHRLHHFAPFSARFHRFLDPGWLQILLLAKLGLAWNVQVAVRIGQNGFSHQVWQPRTAVQS